MEIIKKTPVREALQCALDAFGAVGRFKEVHISDSLGHILAEDAFVNMDLPPFTKSTVDGYAVRHRDIEAASEETPVLLTVTGESHMGRITGTTLEPGTAQYVPTGGMLPGGADAVVMIEDTVIDGDSLKVFKALSVNENLILKGQDLRCGALGLKSGTKMYPRHIGLLASMGIERVKVYGKPVVSIIITGDEIIPLGTALKEGQIYDINSYSLKALCESYGLEVCMTSIVVDDYDAMCRKIDDSLSRSDVLLISGGSSVGKKDYTVDAVKSRAGTEVLVHGLAFKPGKPTLIAKQADKLILGLPGHPVSSIMVMDIVGRRLLDGIWNMALAKRHRIQAVLTDVVEPAFERDSCQMVRVESHGDTFLAKPIYGKSGMISWIGHSDGYIVAEYKDGPLPKGSLVEVFLWDNHSSYIGNDWV